MGKDKSVCRPLLSVRDATKNNLPFVSTPGTQDDLLVSVASSANKGFVDLDQPFQNRAFIHQMILEASAPSPHGHMRQSRDLKGCLEGHVLLPAVEEEPEVLERKLHTL